MELNSDAFVLPLGVNLPQLPRKTCLIGIVVQGMNAAEVRVHERPPERLRVSGTQSLDLVRFLLRQIIRGKRIPVHYLEQNHISLYMNNFDTVNHCFM